MVFLHLHSAITRALVHGFCLELYLFDFYECRLSVILKSGLKTAPYCMADRDFKASLTDSSFIFLESEGLFLAPFFNVFYTFLVFCIVE